MRKKLNVELFAGSSDLWGVEVTYAPHENSLTVMLIHWYFGVSIWRDREA
jgi:hypothetical protein